MIENGDKINVIIPTRERADTLYHCLKTVVNQNYRNLNIIVSDNFSQDNTKEIVSSMADSRIKHINTGKRISMSHNWEFALNHVSEGWVTFLGDDDGILPGGIERVSDIINKTGAKAIVSKWGFYYWPESTEFENKLTVPLTTGYEIRNSEKWLKKLMCGKANYIDLPYIYTGGFVDISAVNAARNKIGDFFCSMIPDVYSAIAIASTVEKYVMINEPVAVMGVSSHSGGASGLGIGKSLEPSKKFYSETNIPFHPRLGSERVKSIRISIYECYLQSIHLHKDALKVNMIEQLNLAMAQSTKDYASELLDYCKHVASINGLDINSIDTGIMKYILTRLSILKIAVLSIFKCQTIDARMYFVYDVFGASQISRTIHQYFTTDKHSGIYRLFLLTAKRLMRNFQ